MNSDVAMAMARAVVAKPSATIEQLVDDIAQAIDGEREAILREFDKIDRSPIVPVDPDAYTLVRQRIEARGVVSTKEKSRA